MADFYDPNADKLYPNIAQQAMSGYMAPIQAQSAQLGLQSQRAMLPYQVQQAQQGIQAGALNIQQLRLALQRQQRFTQAADDYFGAPGTSAGGAQNAPSSTGGIQTGPQPGASTGPSTGPVQASGSFDGSMDNNFDLARRSRDMAVMGMLQPEAVKGMQEGQAAALKQAQIQAQGPIDTAERIRNSPAPARTIMSTPTYMAQFAQWASAHGIDPVRGFQDDNVRMFLGDVANQARQASRQPVVNYPMPVGHQAGPYGQQFDVDPITGARKEVAPAHTPTMNYQEVTDPNDPIRTIVVARQTGGWPGTGGGAPAPGQPGGTAGGPNAYYKPPDQNEAKAAQFADYYHGGIQPLEALEAQGVRLGPVARAAIINAAVSDSDGMTGEVGRQLLLNYGLNAQDKEYMSALLPILQAMGHSMAGMKLTASQMRTNFEGLIPQQSSDPAALATINNSRSTFYRGLLSQAGTAVQLPQYRGTLGADLARQSAGPSSNPAPASALAYLKAHPDTAAAFKAKYGYAP